MDKKVLIIGDVIKDVYVTGRALGLSAETPTVVMSKDYTVERPGGAANTQAHFRHMGVVGVLYRENPRMTKTRYMVDDVKLLQVDEEHDEPQLSVLDFEWSEDNLFKCYDAVIITDNRHGLIPNKEVAQTIVNLCKDACVPLYVNSQVSQAESNHHWYQGCDVMVINRREFRDCYVGQFRKMVPHNIIVDEVGELADTLGIGTLIVTQGADDVVAYSAPDGYHRISPPMTKVVDSTGSGDAFLAKFTTLKLMGETDGWALNRAAVYASKTCEYLGTGVRHDR